MYIGIYQEKVTIFYSSLKLIKQATVTLTVSSIEASDDEDTDGQSEQVLVEGVESGCLKGTRLSVVEVPANQDRDASDRDGSQEEQLHELERGRWMEVRIMDRQTGEGR